MTKVKPDNPLEAHPRFVKVKDLNSGAFGFVQLARDTHNENELVAIKFIQRGASRITKYVQREVLNQWRLLHPHVCQFIEVFNTEKYLGIAMEYAAGGDMFAYVKARGGLDEADARWFFQQLIIGMDYCHKMGVVNRDIKLENTLLDGSKRPLLKICDFGYSKHLQNDSMPKSRVGTPGYTAPEVISHKPSYDGKAADVWSAGVMLYTMLFCEYPFERANDPKDGPTRYQKVFERILKVDYHIPSGFPISRECRDMLAQILVVDPRRRATIADIERHPWFRVDLPEGVMKMNDDCLNLRNFQAGTQSEAEIQAILEEAMDKRVGLSQEDYEAAEAEEVDYMYSSQDTPRAGEGIPR